MSTENIDPVQLEIALGQEEAQSHTSVLPDKNTLKTLQVVPEDSEWAKWWQEILDA